MKNNKEDRRRPTLGTDSEGTAGNFVAIGVLLNESFYPESGDKLIGAPLEYRNTVLKGVDLGKTVLGRYLPIYYTYAYDGRVIPGYERDRARRIRETTGRSADFALIFRSDSAYFDLCLDVAGLDVETDVGHLQDMIDRLRARRSLDEGSSMSIGELALLADMSERSVRNALTVEEDREG